MLDLYLYPFLSLVIPLAIVTFTYGGLAMFTSAGL